MGIKRYLEIRDISNAVTVSIYEAAAVDAIAFVSVRASLLNRLSDPIWSDSHSEGRNIIRRRAITDDFIRSQDFAFAISQNGRIFDFARCDHGRGAISNITAESLYFLVEIPDTPNGHTAADFVRSGQIRRARLEFETYCNHRDFVDTIQREENGRIILHYEIKKIVGVKRLILEAKTSDLDTASLREFCRNRRPIYRLKTYGVGHGDRVAQYGRALFVPGANLDVILAFAYLHDVERTDDAEDDAHGYRAARLVGDIKDTYLAELTPPEIDLLLTACRSHSDGQKTGNLTVDICHDADLLDLARLGETPDPEKMATAGGAELAADPQKRAEILNTAGISIDK